MAGTLYITGDKAADKLLNTNGNALLLGMLLDQQVPMEWAFTGPQTLKRRLGHLDPKKIAAMDVDEFVSICCEKPAIHRFPGSMGKRCISRVYCARRGLPGQCGQHLEGRRHRQRDLTTRLKALPGYGDEKSKIFVALLAKTQGVEPDDWQTRPASSATSVPRSVADVHDEVSLGKVREWKKAQKAAKKDKQGRGSGPLSETSFSARLAETSPRARLNSAAPFLVVTAVSLWLTRSFWFPGHYVVGFDTYAYSGPNVEVTEQALRHWHLPVLNDLIFGGVPHLGNPQAGVLYPPQLLHLLMGTNRAMGVIVAAHVLLFGLGMLVLARRLGLSVVGATSAAVIATAAGSTLTKTVQYEQILVVAWIPLLVVAIHAVITSARPWRAVAGLATATAAILLAGHPQLVYQAAVFAGAATIGFAVDDGRWRRLGHVCLGAALGVTIAIPQLVTALYATADSAITGGRDLEALRSPALSLPRKDIARAVLGTVQDRDPAAFASGFENIVFIGVVVALLVIVGAVPLLMCRRSRPWAIALGVVGLLALSWATGPRSLLFRIAFDVVPGFDLARASSRWLVIVVIVAAIFAGAGVDAVVQGARRVQFATALIAAASVTALLVFGWLVTADRRSAVIWAVTACAALTLLAVNTFVPKLTRVVPPSR